MVKMLGLFLKLQLFICLARVGNTGQAAFTAAQSGVNVTIRGYRCVH